MPQHDNGWDEELDKVRDEADRIYQPGMRLDPHDGKSSDLNLHLADLLAEPNPNVPDIMAGWTPASHSDLPDSMG